jgi:dihydroorotate dehydrogenase
MSDLSKLARTIKGIKFPHPLMVGGGVFKLAEELREVAASDVIPEWGSIETDPSSGNGGNDYDAAYTPNGHNLRYTRNRRGIPNPGIAYVERESRDIISMYADQGKIVGLNVSGKSNGSRSSVDDLIELVKRGLDCGFPWITANGACPNKADQPILCDDEDAVSEFFERADVEIGSTDAILMWKVSNGMRRSTLAHNKGHVAKSKAFTGIITGNTVPNTLDFDIEGKPTVLTEKDNSTWAGQGGPAIHPIALGHTKFCAQDMPEGKIVVGAGGVEGWPEARNFFRVGATLAQVVSTYLEADKHSMPGGRRRGAEFISNTLVNLAESTT